jgi:FlaA1/EpsC-like NDP-sugar epimerase
MKSLRIIDLAKSMIELKGTPNHKITEIGIRPGEKLHEELITKDEIVRTKELKNMYVIPSYNSKKYDKLPKIKSVYSSESSPLMLLDEIKKNLTRLKFEEFLL